MKSALPADLWIAPLLNFYDKFKVIYFDNGVYKPKIKNHVSVKEAVFPFLNFPVSIRS